MVPAEPIVFSPRHSASSFRTNTDAALGADSRGCARSRPANLHHRPPAAQAACSDDTAITSNCADPPSRSSLRALELPEWSAGCAAPFSVSRDWPCCCCRWQLLRLNAYGDGGVARRSALRCSGSCAAATERLRRWRRGAPACGCGGVAASKARGAAGTAAAATRSSCSARRAAS